MFEVFGDHVYHVANNGVLVHNAKSKKCPVDDPVSTTGNDGPAAGPLQGSGGPGKVYEIDGAELVTGKDYIGKTRRPTVADRMKDMDHREKTPTGEPPNAKTLAENLSIEEMDGVEGLLIFRRGLDHLSNKMQGRDFSLKKNKSRLDAGKRILGEE